MSALHTPRNVLALAVTCLVAACGGESPAPSSVQSFVASITPDAPKSDRLKTLAVGGSAGVSAATAITNAQLFQWAQLQYPEIFGAAAPIVIANYPFDGKLFDVRDFRNGSYLGVANGRAYGLGPFTNGALVDFGPVQQYADLVCARLNCAPTDGGGGTVNACTMPASQALQTGNIWRATYVGVDFIPTSGSREYSVEGRVEGPAVFQGMSAVKSTTTLTDAALGSVPIQVAATYARAAQGGLIETLANESEMTIGGFINRSRSVYTPPDLNSEFALAVGGTLSKTVISIETSSVGGLPLPPQGRTETVTTNYKYEARENIAVQGRSYDTCRYRIGDATGFYGLQWYIVGKGFLARYEQYTSSNALASRIEMKSGTFNGAPL
jgi:hypothetical protein